MIEISKIDVSWKFQMKEVPGFGLDFVKDNLSEETEKPLNELVAETENSTI